MYFSKIASKIDTFFSGCSCHQEKPWTKTRNSDRNKCILKRAKYLIFAWITLFDMGTVCQAQWEDFHFRNGSIRVHIDKVKMVTFSGNMYLFEFFFLKY